MSADHSHLHWGAEQLWETLEPLLPGLTVEVLARCESTNTLLLERARLAGRRDLSGERATEVDRLDARSAEPAARAADSGFGRRADDTEPCLLVAEQQTRGRGRMGRLWQSSAGASLTFSLGLAMSPADWSGMSLAVGVALAEALDPRAEGAAARIGLKWPNDLWLIDGPGRGRKLGGVLIETVAVGARRMVVVGVGLNVLPQPTRELGSGYACLQEIDPQASAPAALHRIAQPLVAALQRFERQGFAEVAERYAARDLLAGQPVVATAGPAQAGGIAEGVGSDGALRVRCADGLHLLTSGEVSVRLRDQPAADRADPADAPA